MVEADTGSEIGAGVWELDPRLAADGPVLADLPLCRLLLVDNAAFPWLVLVPRIAGAIEIVDLGEADRGRLIEEIAAVSRALRGATACHKLNVGALGNVVAQLHVHVVARFRDDAAGTRPVWGLDPQPRYEAAERERLIAAILADLPGVDGGLAMAGRPS